MNRSDDWMTVGDVAEELKVPPARVYRLIRDTEGPLPAHRITPRTIRINRDELRAWLDTRKTSRTETDSMLWRTKKRRARKFADWRARRKGFTETFTERLLYAQGYQRATRRTRRHSASRRDTDCP